MQAFEIVVPTNLRAAAQAFHDGEEAMYLSGGMTLVPSMKARLATPQRLIDLSHIDEMKGIVDTGPSLRLGALTRMAEVVVSPAVLGAIPELSRMAGLVADRHVRNRGTIGGSIANNDPAADFPAAVLALGATLFTDRREIAANDYFQGLFTTALEEGEILVAVDFPKPKAAAYVKHAHPASGYAVAGVFVARLASGWRVAVTGAGAEGVFRLASLEAALRSRTVDEALAVVDFDKLEVLDEPAFPAAFRRNLISWLVQGALRKAG